VGIGETTLGVYQQPLTTIPDQTLFHDQTRDKAIEAPVHMTGNATEGTLIFVDRRDHTIESLKASRMSGLESDLKLHP